MKKQNGVTLTTLTIYIIVATIFLGTLTFVNVNFMSELGFLTNRSKAINETTKFYAFFIEDVKSANRVLEFSENYIKFDTGVEYVVEYRSDNENMATNQDFDVYEIYRDDILITDKFAGVFFDYNDENKYIRVRLYYEDESIINEEQYFKVGRGY